MASKFELVNPAFTSVSQSSITNGIVVTDLPSSTGVEPIVTELVDGFFEYKGTPKDIEDSIVLPPAKDILLQYPDALGVNGSFRFIVCNRYDRTKHASNNVKVEFHSSDNYSLAGYFPNLSGGNQFRVVEPQTQVEFSVTLRGNVNPYSEEDDITAVVCAYPALFVPAA